MGLRAKTREVGAEVKQGLPNLGCDSERYMGSPSSEATRSTAFTNRSFLPNPAVCQAPRTQGSKDVRTLREG